MVKQYACFYYFGDFYVLLNLRFFYFPRLPLLIILALGKCGCDAFAHAPEWATLSTILSNKLKSWPYYVPLITKYKRV